MRQIAHLARVASATYGATVLADPERALTVGSVTVPRYLGLLIDSSQAIFVDAFGSVDSTRRLLAVQVERSQRIHVSYRRHDGIVLVRRDGHTVTTHLAAHVLSEVRVEADAHGVDRLRERSAHAVTDQVAVPVLGDERAGRRVLAYQRRLSLIEVRNCVLVGNARVHLLVLQVSSVERTLLALDRQVSAQLHLLELLYGSLVGYRREVRIGYVRQRLHSVVGRLTSLRLIRSRVDAAHFLSSVAGRLWCADLRL